MAKLEYRLLKPDDTFVSIYHYQSIELEQILARRECEFFVKEGITYKQTSSAVEDDIHIIYVKEHEHGPKEQAEGDHRKITLEVRELNSLQGHPILFASSFYTHLDVLSYIGTVYTYYNGLEWERDSAEIDEDRSVYSLYVTKTGVTYERGKA
ncbi:hypothetical protein ACH0CI_09085 [Priestia sp. 179-F W1.4 NHS]|uniref:hypothetical protein n=1 Tax=Priestia sp. 179-F W1.4 NHS TaxID=3374296 RepID=UPI00387A1FE1